MPQNTISELQERLFKRMGIATHHANHDPRSHGVRSSSRKDDRRLKRDQKRVNRYSRDRVPARFGASDGQVPMVSNTRSSETRERSVEWFSCSDQSSADERSESRNETQSIQHATAHDDKNSGRLTHPQNTTKAVRDKLAQDDAEIEDFERKLGIRKGRTSLPQAFEYDGLGDLLGHLNDSSTVSKTAEPSRSRSEYEEWLASKRRSRPEYLKGTAQERSSLQEPERRIAVQSGADDEYMWHSDISTDSMETGLRVSGKNMKDSNLKEREITPAATDKENPYTAPRTGAIVTKYIPPPLRKASDLKSEHYERLQKKLQGLINRLTDTNILSIVRAAENLYQDNPRGDVTECLTETLFSQVCKPQILPDQFLVLAAGFTAALYKIIGVSFGSHILRRLVLQLSEDCRKARDQPEDEPSIRREASNLTSFLAQLYVFEAISCKIVFDYMERFLEDLTDFSVEMLLRICRSVGRLLRRDDPQALNHVVGILNREISKSSRSKISVRTGFMVETIKDLNNSKPRAKGIGATIVSEHVVRMKKRLGELKSQSRRLDGLTPLGVSLDDIEAADTHGKWWLVGASVPVKEQRMTLSSLQKEAIGDTEKIETRLDEEDMDFVLPDYPRKARAQGFNTMAQIAIFTALMSASSAEQGCRQYIDLRLKRDEQLEIVRVLVQCVGSEANYNEYYALVAQQVCSQSRLRFAFQDRLWKMFRSLGESLFGEDAEEEGSADSQRMKDARRMKNVAYFYAALVANRSLNITVLKPLELPGLNEWTTQFLENFFTRLLLYYTSGKENEDARIEEIFGPAREIPSLAAGLHWFFRKRLRKTKLVDGQNSRKLQRKRQKVQAIVEALSVA